MIISYVLVYPNEDVCEQDATYLFIFFFFNLLTVINAC